MLSPNAGNLFFEKAGVKARSTVMGKEEAYRPIDGISEDATREDLIRGIYVLEAIERGLSDSKAGHIMDVNELRGKYGLPE